MFDAFRKLALRRDLLRDALPGAAYVPFCGDGDLAVELYADRAMLGCDVDEDRLKVIRERLPQGEWIAQDADDPLWGRRLEQETHIFAVADFDSYSFPYEAFRVFWQSDAKLARRLILFFTDGQPQSIKRGKPFISPDGEKHQPLPVNERRALFNFYWTQAIQPWFRAAIAPWTVSRDAFYLRAGNMCYWGAVVDAPREASGEAPDPDVENVESLRAREEGDIPTPDNATDAELGYDPLKHWKFDAEKRRQFLKLIASGSNRTAAAKAVGVNLKTIERALDDRRFGSRFDEMLSWAEMEVDDEIEGSLFQAARSGNVPAIQMWLYNRRPERWADRRRHDVNMVVDQDALKVIADIIARTVTDPDTLSRLRSELARLGVTGRAP